MSSPSGWNAARVSTTVGGAHTAKASRTWCPVRRTARSSATLHGVSERDTVDGADVDFTFSLAAGELRAVRLRDRGGGGARAKSSRRTATRLFRDTVDFWRDWLGRSTYSGRWREDVERSAMVLKMLHVRTERRPGRGADGGAAGTARRRPQLGLPLLLDPRRLVLGLRTARARLHRRGHRVHALDGRPRRRAGGRGIRAAEDHVPDRRLVRPGGAHPRRTSKATPGRSRCDIGNGAADQLQLDIYGEAMDALAIARRLPADRPSGLDEARRHARLARDNWDQPDEGVWETRGGRKDFTYGRSHVLGRPRPRHPHRAGPRPPCAARDVDRLPATPSTSRCSRAAGTRNARPSRSIRAPTCWMPSPC